MLAYRQLGQGPDLVLLHGWGMSGAVFADLAWRLAPSFRITLLDWPGHGASPCLEGFSLDRGLHALRDTLTLLGIEQAVLTGWSLGGQLAIAHAARHPAGLRALILMATTPCFVARGDWVAGMPPATFQRFGDDLLRDPAAALKRFFALQALGDSAARAALMQVQAGVLQALPQRECLMDGLALLSDLDLRAVLARIDMPVLILQGENDRIVAPEAGAYLREALPDGRLACLPGAGHAPFLSAPDACARAIRDFLGVS